MRTLCDFRPFSFSIIDPKRAVFLVGFPVNQVSRWILDVLFAKFSSPWFNCIQGQKYSIDRMNFLLYNATELIILSDFYLLLLSFRKFNNDPRFNTGALTVILLFVYNVFRTIGTVRLRTEQLKGRKSVSSFWTWSPRNKVRILSLGNEVLPFPRELSIFLAGVLSHIIVTY